MKPKKRRSIKPPPWENLSIERIVKESHPKRAKR
jgi:hypothetical protein